MPVVIGVTGHRHLPAGDLPELERTIDGAFDWIREQAPTAPIVVLSALAEGADRLVADRLLLRGARLRVVLPFPRSEYERDFRDGDSLSEFRTLLNRADAVIELKGARGDDSGGGYQAVGHFISDHATVLFGLWDGEDAQGVGGAAEIIRWHCQGGRSRRRERLVDAAHGYVIHIPVRRPTAHTSARPATGEWRVLPDERCAGEDEDPGADQKFELATLLRRLQAFYTDLQATGTRQATRAKGGAPATERAGIIDAAFTAVDALSVRYQRYTERLRRSLFVLVFMGVAFFAVCAHHMVPHGWVPYLLGLYLLVLGFAYGLHLRYGTAPPIRVPGRRQRIGSEDRYLDYRVIAEYLRVVRFWRIGGVPDRVEDHLPLYGQGFLDWVVFPLKALALMATERGEGFEKDGASEAAWRTVRQGWIDDQRAYFERAQQRYLHAWHRVHRWVQVLFVVSVVGLGLLLALYVSHQHELWCGMAHNLLVTFISLTALGSAMLHAYGDKRGDLDHARQAERMHLLFRSADRKAKTSDSAQERAALVRHLGREAINEVADWLLLRRSRPVEVPKAG
jgi:hypothetical protein